MPSGYLIDEWLLAGVLNDASSTTRYIKVEQGKPDKKTWIQWQRLMQLVGVELHSRPLGAWLDTASNLRRWWPCYLDIRSKLLYVRSAEGFVQNARNQAGDYGQGLEDTAWTPTDHCVPVEADPSGRGTYFLNEDSIHGIVPSAVPPVAQTFLEYIDDLPEWNRSLFQWLKLLVDPFELQVSLFCS